LRNELVQKGYKRLRKFSWNEMAKKTLNIYEQIRKS